MKLTSARDDDSDDDMTGLFPTIRDDPVPSQPLFPVIADEAPTIESLFPLIVDDVPSSRETNALVPAIHDDGPSSSSKNKDERDIIAEARTKIQMASERRQEARDVVRDTDELGRGMIEDELMALPFEFWNDPRWIGGMPPYRPPLREVSLSQAYRCDRGIILFFCSCDFRRDVQLIWKESTLDCLSIYLKKPQHVCSFALRTPTQR